VATIHETAIEGGAAVARHFCQEHGAAVWQAAVPHADPQAEAAALQAIGDYLRSLSDEEKSQLAELCRLSRRSS
jgi:hypothetical protein